MARALILREGDVLMPIGLMSIRTDFGVIFQISSITMRTVHICSATTPDETDAVAERLVRERRKGPTVR